jgi:hypothetical protein
LKKQLGKEQTQLSSAKREQLVFSNAILTSDIERNKQFGLEAKAIEKANKARLDSQNLLTDLNNQITELSSKDKEGNKDKINGLVQQLQEKEKQLAFDEQSLAVALEGTDPLVQRLALANQLITAAEENIAQSKEELKTQEKINSAMGITGGILKGLNKIGGEFTKALNLDKVQEDMRGFTEEAQRAENELAKAEGRTAKTISRISVLGKGISSAFGNLKQKISDPAVIFTTLADAAFSVSQDITDIQRSTGMSYKNASLLNAELRNTAQNSGQTQISVKKIHEAFVAITKETGMSAEILGTEALISMSNLK